MSNFKRMFVVFDLDGTLADGTHREHHITRPVGEKDWSAYFAECHNDLPKIPIIQTMRALMVCGHRCEIWTGRSAEVTAKTRQWLCEHGLAVVNIRQRAEGDHTQDDVLKEKWLDASDIKPDLVFEDRARVVSMWRSHGITCCQVAPGEF